MKISAYRKSVIAGAGSVLLAAQAAVSDGRIDSAEWIPIGVAVLVALGVFAKTVPIRSAGRSASFDASSTHRPDLYGQHGRLPAADAAAVSASQFR
jgi:hypothetical protein